MKRMRHKPVEGELFLHGEAETYRDMLRRWADGPRSKSHRAWCAELGLHYNRLFSLIYRKNGSAAPLAEFYHSLITERDIAGARYGKGKNYGKL